MYAVQPLAETPPIYFPFLLVCICVCVTPPPFPRERNINRKLFKKQAQTHLIALQSKVEPSCWLMTESKTILLIKQAYQGCTSDNYNNIVLEDLL